MALPIRPSVWPPAPVNIQPGRNHVRRTAQKAFFEAALAGQASAAPKVAASDAPRASAPRDVRAAANVEASAADAKIPRPGSIVDIWV
jgi:hypothetical protein